MIVMVSTASLQGMLIVLLIGIVTCYTDRILRQPHYGSATGVIPYSDSYITLQRLLT